MSRKLVVEIIGDASSLDRSLKQATVASNRFGKEVSHSLRGVVSGTGIMHGFGRSLAFASGGFLAFEGVSRFLEESIKAGQGAVGTQRSLAAQMKTSGESFKTNQEAIDKAGLSLAKFGFTSESADQALVVLDRATGNISQSQKLLTVSADLARAKNLDLAAAANIVAKVFGGQETALRRAVPGLDKTAHGTDLVREAQAKLAGQARAATTPQEKFAAELFNTEKIVGTALLPTFNKYLGELSTWLERMNQSGQLQKDVNQAVGAAKDILNLAAGAMKTLNSISGSTKETLKLLFDVFVAFKTLKLVDWLTGVSGGLRRVGTEAETSTGKVKGLRGAFGSLPEVVAITLGIDVVMSAHTTAHGAHRYSGSAGWGNLWHDLGHPVRLIQNLSGGGGGGPATSGGNLFSPGFKLPNITANVPVEVPHDLPTVQAALPIVGRGGLTPMQRNALAISAAARTKSTKDDMAAFVTQRQLLAKAIATETARLNQATSAGQAKKFADNLQSLYDKDAANNDRIAGIVKKGAQQQGKTGAELAAQRNTFFDNAITRMLDRVTDIGSAGGRIAGLEKVNALITKRIAATKDITRKLNLEDQVIANLRSIKGERSQQQQDVIDALGLKLSRADLTKSVSDNIAVLQETNAKLAEQNRLYGVTGEREREIIANKLQIQGYEQQQKDQRKQARDTARQNLLDQLQFNVDKAELTKGQGDNLKALLAEKAGILKMIAAEGLTLANQKELLRVQLEINAKNQEIADARKARKDAAKQALADAKQAAADTLAAAQASYDAAVEATRRRQFTELGLLPSGDEPIFNTKLQAQLRKVREGIKGTSLDTADLRKQLAGVGKVLTEKFIPYDVGQKIQSILDGITSSLKGLHGEVTKFRHVSSSQFVDSLGLHLSPLERTRLRMRVAEIGAGGTVANRNIQFAGGGTPIVIHSATFHGVTDMREMEQQLTRRTKSRAHTRRGD